MDTSPKPYVMETANRSRKISDSAVGEITNDNIKIETSTGTIDVDISDEHNCELWIFGYGSLEFGGLYILYEIRCL